MKKIRVGYALCGSFCTFEQSINVMRKLVADGYDVIPIMSFNAYFINTRFGEAEKFIEEIETICLKSIIHTIEGAEPIGPNKSCDILVISPCTGNTLAKLANSITDTPVTMAVKSQIRNSRPVLIAVSTNDALSGNSKNIGTLLNIRNYYFVPFCQDNPLIKPTSLISDFEQIPNAIKAALNNEQLQPIFT